MERLWSGEPGWHIMPRMIDALVNIVRTAGEAILRVYGGDFAVTEKADESPLTEADLRAHKIIAAGLRQLAPDWPLISEEANPPPFAIRRRWRKYWLVDPLDGTREFIDRNGEFTVNIALIEDGEPVVGVVGVPARETIYVGDRRERENGAGRAFRLDAQGETPLRARALRADRMAVVASRRHGGERLGEYLRALRRRFHVSTVPVGSSLKLCVLADGEADVYPRLGPTSEWDIAAAHAVLAAAGGAVLWPDGNALTYNAKDSLLNPSFLAVADPAFPWRDHLPSA